MVEAKTTTRAPPPDYYSQSNPPSYDYLLDHQLEKVQEIDFLEPSARENTFYEYDIESSLNEITSSSPLGYGSDTLVSLDEVVMMLQEFIQVNLKDSQAGGIMIQDFVKQLIHSSSY